MGYYIDTSNCGGAALPYYSCSLCPDTEYGRIRAAFVVKRSYYDSLIAGITSASTWTTAVSAGNVIVFPLTQGSYDGGNVTELTGFGDFPTMNGNTTHTAEIMDINFSANCDFWNAIRDSREYIFGYVTSSKVWIPSGSAVATITPKNPVADDINSVIGYKVGFKWISPDSPCEYTKPSGVFDSCIVRS